MKRKFIYFFIIIGIIALVYFRFTNRTSNQSIKYEDKNSNGIWDDVEPFIKANAKNELQKKALEFEAKAFQEIILNPENALEVKQGNYSQDILGRAFACRRIVWGRLTNAQGRPDIRDTILASRARVHAYIKYHKNLSGAVFGLWEDKNTGNPCPFEVGNLSEK